MRRSLAPSQLPNGSPKAFVSPFQNKRRRICESRESKENVKTTPVKVPVSDYEAAIAKVLSKPFKVPIPNYVPDYHSNRCLGIKRSVVKRALHDPFACNALVLYEPPPCSENDKIKSDQKVLVHVVVDPILSNILRPHQREGVRFMYDCVTGVRGDFFGCIMADEMGLGKTLQCVTLVWTLLRQGPECKPIINKAIIISPSSLVKNWEKEFQKWLLGRMHCLVIDSGSKEQTIKNLEQYMANKSQRAGTPVLLISYETFRIYADILNASEVGIVICDEGHRLKNNDNLTYRALMGLQTKRRVLISGTPIQNDLTEYYSLVNFVNPEMLGTPTVFKRHYETPISRGQNADSTDAEREKAGERLQELNKLVNQCMIRRTNQILTKYLPIKFEMVICVKMTECQLNLYKNFINSDRVKTTLCENGDSKPLLSALADITSLKKLCNHPDLIYEKIEAGELGFKGGQKFLPGHYSKREILPELSGKVMLLDFMLASIKANSDDKVVLVSNYTQTLDLFEKLCYKRKYNYVRLDGSMTIKKRSKVVDEFNNKDTDKFVFMLSSKAGGCGLNLIGANRLFMFDPDWNPANDDQAMARVWRDGQQKPCFIYRFLATGSIEEKIFQRQTHKKSLSNTVVDNNDSDERHFTRDDLKDLFTFNESVTSDTHLKFKCKRCVNDIQIKPPPENSDCTSHLSQWFHCTNNKGLPDTVLSQAWTESKCVSFVFHHRSAVVEKPKIAEVEEEEVEEKVEYEDPPESEESDYQDDSDESYHA